VTRSTFRARSSPLFTSGVPEGRVFEAWGGVAGGTRSGALPNTARGWGAWASAFSRTAWSFLHDCSKRRASTCTTVTKSQRLALGLQSRAFMRYITAGS